jgi:hypothetical protein
VNRVALESAARNQRSVNLQQNAASIIQLLLEEGGLGADLRLRRQQAKPAAGGARARLLAVELVQLQHRFVTGLRLCKNKRKASTCGSSWGEMTEEAKGCREDHATDSVALQGVNECRCCAAAAAADLHCMISLGAACALTTDGALCCMTCRRSEAGSRASTACVGIVQE